MVFFLFFAELLLSCCSCIHCWRRSTDDRFTQVMKNLEFCYRRPQKTKALNVVVSCYSTADVLNCQMLKEIIKHSTHFW